MTIDQNSKRKDTTRDTRRKTLISQEQNPILRLYHVFFCNNNFLQRTKCVIKNEKKRKKLLKKPKKKEKKN